MSISLVALRGFEAAARHMSFKMAAAELNLSATAISHQVRSLEKSLGHTLFNRKVRKVTLTAEGEELFQTLTPAFQSIDTAVRKLQSYHARYTVTLGTGPIFGSRWLAPKLGLFWKQNPDIDLRLHHSPLPIHQQMTNCDMAVAWGKDNWQNFIAEPLLSIHVSPVYAPFAEFAKNKILDPSEILKFPLLHHRDHSAWNLWLEAMGIRPPEKLTGIVFEDANVQLQAALEGQGIALGFLPLIENEISTGRLIQPWKNSTKLIESYYLLYFPNSVARKPVASVRNWLLSIGSEY